MRVVLVGGGTVGHVTPALAIADEIKERDDSSKFLFIGREGGEENKEVRKKKIPLTLIHVRGLKRSLSPKNLKTLFILKKAIKKAKEILEDFKPDVVIGTGGYVCFPVITAAKKLKIPSVIHESNSRAGMTTKLLSKKCDKVFLGFAEAMRELKYKDNVTVSGTPVSRDFYVMKKDASREKLNLKKNDLFILSFGGSGGAEKLNEVILKVMREYSQAQSNLRHVHATGRKYFTEEIKKSAKALSKNCSVQPYIENMPLMIMAADIIISRSGAMTLAEIAAAQKASILIPSPNVTGNHQYLNAKALSDINAAILIEEKELTEERVMLEINRLKSREERGVIEKNIATLHKNDCIKMITKEIYELIQGRK